MPATTEKPKIQTTLGSATSERMDVVTRGSDTLAPAVRSRRPLLVAAGVVAAVAAVVFWVKRPAPVSPPSPTIAIAAPVATPPPTLPPAPTPAPTPTASPSAPPVAPAPPAVAAGPVKPAAAPAARKIKIAISSEPSGADVCLSKDHILLGKTNFEWSTDKSARTAKLLIRKRGYRGREIAITADRDGKKQVTLSQLGPDDLDDTDNCERR